MGPCTIAYEPVFKDNIEMNEIDINQIDEETWRDAIKMLMAVDDLFIDIILANAGLSFEIDGLAVCEAEMLKTIKIKASLAKKKREGKNR